MYWFRFFTFTLMAFEVCFASDLDLDEEQADSLKIEATHDDLRIKSFKEEISNNKIFDSVRESGLAEYLEDQEDFELAREEGLSEYLKNKKKDSQSYSDSSYDQYVKDKQKSESEYEASRKKYIKTRNKFVRQKILDLDQIEYKELGLDAQRPRFSLFKRSKPNKWMQGVTMPKGNGISSGESGYQVVAPPAPPPDYSPTNEFPAPPPAYENFEDGSVPQPYELPYDPTFTGEGMPIPPPPPPPPPDYDF